MNQPNAGTSPRTKARITGFFYLLTILTGIFAGGYVSGTLIAAGDAATTPPACLWRRKLRHS